MKMTVMFNLINGPKKILSQMKFAIMLKLNKDPNKILSRMKIVVMFTLVTSLLVHIQIIVESLDWLDMEENMASWSMSNAFIFKVRMQGEFAMYNSNDLEDATNKSITLFGWTSSNWK